MSVSSSVAEIDILFGNDSKRILVVKNIKLIDLHDTIAAAFQIDTTSSGSNSGVYQDPAGASFSPVIA